MAIDTRVPGGVIPEKGFGGLSCLSLRAGDAYASVYLHGAHVLDYRPAGQPPVLWHSRNSAFSPGSPIRGGIPVCWPWFGAHPEDGTQPSHGLARLTQWDHAGVETTATATTVILRLPPRLPDRTAEARLRVTLHATEGLDLALTTINRGTSPLCLSEALHTYFAVRDVRHVSVTGLEGASYLDTCIAGNPVRTEPGPVRIQAETDRLYTGIRRACAILDPGWKRRIRIRKWGSRSTVVWNPWIAKAARLPDFGDDEYPGMLCVETANAGPDAIPLPPGRMHTMRLHIRSEPSYDGD